LERLKRRGEGVSDPQKGWKKGGFPTCPTSEKKKGAEQSHGTLVFKHSKRGKASNEKARQERLPPSKIKRI